MRPIRDPEGAELSHLKAACDLAGKDILEIGCGDGKFIRQYAGLPRKVIGIDTDITDLRTARQAISLPGAHSSFVQTAGEKLPFPSQKFNLAIFASSL